MNVGSTSLRPPICGTAWLRLPRTGIDLKWPPTMQQVGQALPPANCRRDDVILVLFPDSNLRTSKRRPALVVQADQLGAGLPQTIVAMIASNMARAGHPSRVVVRVDSESAKGSGLLMDSVIMTDNLATIQHLEIDRILGAFSELRELDAALRTTLAL